MRTIDEDKIVLKEKPEDVRSIKIRPEAPGLRAKDLIPNLAIIDHHSLEGPGRGCTTYHGTVDGRETPVQGLVFLRIINNGPPSKSPFTTCRVRGVLLPRSFTGTILLDLHKHRSRVYEGGAVIYGFGFHF